MLEKYNKTIDNNVYDITRNFSIRVVNLYKHLCDNNEFIMSKQLFRAGTSIGANVFEGKNAPIERADKLLAIADKIRQDDVRDKVLLQAANLILGKKLF